MSGRYNYMLHWHTWKGFQNTSFETADSDREAVRQCFRDRNRIGEVYARVVMVGDPHKRESWWRVEVMYHPEHSHLPIHSRAILRPCPQAISEGAFEASCRAE